MTLSPTRRTVVRAAAWSVPAVTVVAAAPARAASVAPTISIVSSTATTTTRTGSVVLALTPAPTSTPVPSVQYGDPGAATAAFTLVGAADGTAMYRLDFTTSDPTPASITVTVSVADHGLASTTITARTPGALVTGFVDPVLVSSSGRGLAFQADRKLLVTGSFASVADQPRGRLARLNADGTLDPSFADPQLNSNGTVLALQPDGAVVVGGQFTSVGGVTTGAVARILPSGARDTTFTGPTDLSTIRGLALQTDGKVLAAGNFTVAGGLTRNRLVRLTSTGAVDTAFVNPNLNGATRAVVVQPDGKVVVGGQFTTAGASSATRRGIARFNPDGTLDTTFVDPALTGTSGNADVYFLLLQSDGKILVAGAGIATAGGRPTGNLFRLNADGSHDPSFVPPGFTQTIWALALQADGKVLVAGDYSTVGSSGVTRNRLARFNADGSLDTSFGDPGLVAFALALAVRDDGAIAVGGTFSVVAGQTRRGVALVQG